MGTKKVVTHLEFQTIPQTRKYFWKQRTILFGFFLFNMLKPYAGAIVPLFVVAGSNATGLETYFFATIVAFSIFIWILMKFIPHRYPLECGRYIVDYQLDIDDNNTLSLTGSTQQQRQGSTARSVSSVLSASSSIQSLQTAGERISAPSLMKCVCFLEGWRECGLIKRLLNLLLFVYSIYLLYVYFSIIFGTADENDKINLMKKVPLTTLVVLYASFFFTLYGLYNYESPVFEEMVSNPTTAETYFDDELAKESVQLRLMKEQGKKKKVLEKERMKRLKAKAKAKKSGKQSDLEAGSEGEEGDEDEKEVNVVFTEYEKKQWILKFHEETKQGMFHQLYILFKVFATTFPDECFPMHLTWFDMFRDSSDVLIQLRTIASIVDFYHRNQMATESMIPVMIESDKVMDGNEGAMMLQDITLRQRLHRESNKSQSRGSQANADHRTSQSSFMTDDTNSSFHPKPFLTIEDLSKDEKYCDVDWGIVREGVLPPHVQINFLRMLHVFFLDGLGEHVGHFMDENQIFGRRMAKMISTADESRIWFELTFWCKALYHCFTGMCSCAFRKARKEQRQIFESQVILDDNEEEKENRNENHEGKDGNVRYVSVGEAECKNPMMISDEPKVC
jgi:hypothetical protein